MNKILVLGATGMLGNAVVRYFSNWSEYKVVGTVRNSYGVQGEGESPEYEILTGIDVLNADLLLKVFADVKPHIVINCIGLVKQLSTVNDPLESIPINALLPHRLSILAKAVGARLIHISTDCVYSGKKGMYKESDAPDASDLYGRSKLLGEVTEEQHAITLRTSLIGHELKSSRSLINWFLSQKGKVRGFRNAVFSGLPTIEVAKVIHERVLPNPELSGLYHLSADPINKYELLKLVARAYGKKIEIVPDDDLKIDRSLDCQRFREATGYRPLPWTELVNNMRDHG